MFYLLDQLDQAVQQQTRAGLICDQPNTAAELHHRALLSINFSWRRQWPLLLGAGLGPPRLRAAPVPLQAQRRRLLLPLPAPWRLTAPPHLLPPPRRPSWRLQRNITLSADFSKNSDVAFWQDLTTTFLT